MGPLQEGNGELATKDVGTAEVLSGDFASAFAQVCTLLAPRRLPLKAELQLRSPCADLCTTQAQEATNCSFPWVFSPSFLPGARCWQGDMHDRSKR